MDILAYDYMLQGLKDYNNSVDQNYGNVIVEYPSQKPTYPHTVFDEVRNVENTNYKTIFDKVSSLGYKVDVYAKTKGSVNKKTIARKVAYIVDKYLSNIGLNRVSYNANDNEEGGSIYHIIMTYSGNLHENRRKFI